VEQQKYPCHQLTIAPYKLQQKMLIVLLNRQAFEHLPCSLPYSAIFDPLIITSELQFLPVKKWRLFTSDSKQLFSSMHSYHDALCQTGTKYTSTY
jgi:hypothetical protein